MTRKRGFSLIELLVVLAITAVLLGMGLTSLIGMRNRFVVSQSASEFIQNSTSVRNDARNSVLKGKTNNDLENLALIEKLDFYAIKFENGEYYRGTCNEDLAMNCEFDKGSLKGSQYGNVKAEPMTDNCAGIIFSLTTGKFAFASMSGSVATLNNAETCAYTFEHKNTGFVKMNVTLNKKTGKFKLTNT